MLNTYNYQRNLKKFLNLKRGGSHSRKIKKEEEVYKEISKKLKSVSKKEKLIFLAAIYWGEGSKRDFGFSNTDPNMVKVFISGLEEVFGISKERLSISVRIYEDLDREKCLDFWSEVTGVSKKKFIGVNVLPGKKKGKLQFGMCRVRVKKGGDILKQVVAVNKFMYNSLPL